MSTIAEEASVTNPSVSYSIDINPATGEEIGRVKNTDMSQYPKMVKSARLAQQQWNAYSFKQRSVHIMRMRQYIVDHADELAAIVSESNGKTRTDALATEVLPCALSCNWYGKKAAKVLKPELRLPSSLLFANKFSRVEQLPLGVVGIISPWNYPLSIPFGEVVMGLMAGNAVMLKVADASSMVGDAIERIVKSAGLPDGLFQMVFARGSVVSNAMIKNGLDKIFFTGSVAAGKSIMAAAASTLTPLSLELGGNDPMLVLEDANIERAVNGAIWGGFQNAGQSCGGVERIYVDERIYDEFVEQLRAKTKALKVGIPTAEHSVDIGAITTANQKKSIEDHVNDALAKGARIAAQATIVSGQEKGLFYPPTVLVDVTEDMETVKDETFGPVLAVIKYKNIANAIDQANDSNLALTSSVWTKNIARGKMIARQLETGVTAINDHLYTHGLSETPWGGWKESGLGRTHGPEGLHEMTNTKVINWDLLNSNRNLWWHPHTPETYEALKSAIGFAFPSSFSAYIKHSLKLSPYLMKKMFSKWTV